MEMPYPTFLDILKFHSDPEHYIKPYLSNDEMKDKKDKMFGALEELKQRK